MTDHFYFNFLSQKELPVHISFTPSSMGLISSSLVVKSMAGKTTSKVIHWLKVIYKYRRKDSCPFWLKSLIVRIHTLISNDHLGDWSPNYGLTLKMASTQVVKMSVINNSHFEDISHPDDHFQLRDVTPGFKPITFFNLWEYIYTKGVVYAVQWLSHDTWFALALNSPWKSINPLKSP